MQIYVLNRARETLATTSGIYDDKHTLTLDAGSSSYEFKIDKADEASQCMDSGNYIVLQNDNGKTWLFTILDYEETQYTKTVYAEDAGIELLNKACDIWKSSGPHSFEYYFNIVTSGTPWKLGVNQLAGLERTLTYEGRDTGLGRLLSILKGFDNAECTFDVAVKMNAPSEFKINVYKQVGSDRSDVQMVYNHELDDIVKKESRAEFVTALCGVGGTIQTEDGQGNTQDAGNIDFADLEYNKDGLFTTKGDKFLRAADANKRFNPGQTTYIEAFYEYDTQSASELLNRTITRLKTYSEPQYTYTADVKVIDSTLKIGDTVTIIDHDYNPALYLSARVAKLEKSYTDPSQNTIEFCNYRLLSSRLADKLAKLQTVVNKMPSASQVGKLESNVSNLAKKQEELSQEIVSANGKNTNYYGKTEPANPKNGDLWYKKLENGEVEMYQYQDGVWQLLASTADLTTVQAELDQAKSDMAQAKTDAQNAYDEAIKATNTANGAKAQTDEALKQAKQANDSYTALAKEVADNKASTDADYKQAQADIVQAQKDLASVNTDYQEAKAEIMQAQKDLASVTSTVTEVKKGQGELSTKVAGKVDNATYQTYVKQTNQALSEKLISSDLKGYAKTVDVKHTTDGLSASITKAQGDLNGLQIGGANLLDGTEQASGGASSFDSQAYQGGWRVVTSTKAASARRFLTWPVNLKDGIYTASIDFKCISDTSGQDNKVELMLRDKNYVSYGSSMERGVYKGNQGRLIATCNLSDTQNVVYLQIAVTSTFVGQIAFRHLKLESGNKATDWCMSDNDFQSQLNTLSGKITATSDRLSSVYTKSEVDGKLGTKVEQSALTQTSNSIKATVKDAQNSITSLQADVKGVKTTVADHTGKITQLTTNLDGVKTTVADNTGKISTMQTDINGVKTTVKNAQGNIATLQTDAKSIKATVSDHTGKITQLTADVNGVKSSVSNKVDKTTYQSYVAQTDKALSAKLTASDLKGYAKTADVKHTTDGLSASITKAQGNLAYQATELIGKKSFEDGNVGDWTCNDCKTKAAISGITSYSAYGYHKCIYAPNNNDLCWNVDYKVNPGDKYYVELLAPNFYSVHGGRTITVNAYFKYIKDGKNAWQMGPSGQVVTGTSGWIKGIVTVPANVTSVKPWISVKDNGVASAAYLTYASFTKLDEYTQNQLTTLSGKITATSDRLSSVYTKSETDSKLKTKVEQSVLTQTSNNLSASIAKNSKILSSAGLVNENAYINANKIALNGKTLMTNATINDAFIGNMSANKITTGTLNAAKVNLINVNASNISTGTLNGIKITSTGKDSSGTSSTTTIQSGYIDTNVINCSDYILVGKADADPRKRWQTKQTPQGMWFQTPAKITGHTGNAVSDWQTEWQGFMGGDGWNYRNTTVTGTGYSGIQLALTPQQEWGNPYGGDMMSFGTWIRTETSNKTKNILDGTLDPFLWYSYTGQSAAYKDTVVIPKPLRVFGETHFDWDIHVKGGGSHGIRTAWVSWSDWGSNQKIPCIVNDTNNWGGIAFPSNGRVVLFTHGYRINTDGLPKDKAGTYNGWGN